MGGRIRIIQHSTLISSTRINQEQSFRDK